MKSLLKPVLLLGVTVVALQAFKSLLLSLTNPFNAKDKYKIEWEGSAGKQLFGSYAISDHYNYNKPTRVEKVTATLPYTLSFSTSKGAIVAASGGTLNQGTVTVKISRNGSECGQEVVVGSGVMANKVCR